MNGKKKFSNLLNGYEFIVEISYRNTKENEAFKRKMAIFTTEEPLNGRRNKVIYFKS